MERKRKNTKGTYKSMIEFKRQFLPNSYEKELAEQKRKEPGTFGTGLVGDLLEGIRQQLKR